MSAAVADELAERIAASARAHGGALPQPLAVAWAGYLAALIEWDVIGVPEHDRLAGLLPMDARAPAAEILLGHES